MKCLNRTLKCLPIFFTFFSNAFAEKNVYILEFFCHILQLVMLMYFQPDRKYYTQNRTIHETNILEQISFLSCLQIIQLAPSVFCQSFPHMHPSVDYKKTGLEKYLRISPQTPRGTGYQCSNVGTAQNEECLLFKICFSICSNLFLRGFLYS